MGKKDRSVSVKSGFSILLGVSAENGRAFPSHERVFRPAAGPFQRTGDGQGDRGRKAGDDDRPLRPLRSFGAGGGGGGGAGFGVGREIFFCFLPMGWASAAGVPGKMPGGFAKLGCVLD